MPDNPQRSQHHWFGLSDHRLVAISGRDAVAFAQAQTMNDVAVLRDGEWHWNGWLTAKGRVIALFAVVRIDVDTPLTRGKYTSEIIRIRMLAPQ